VSLDFTPVLNAVPSVKVHLFTAVAALVLGITQFVAPKGTIPHRTIGWVWVGLMAVMISAGFVIRDRFMWGPFSANVCLVPGKTQIWMIRCGALHVLSTYALLALPYAVLHARRGNIETHRWVMFSILFGAVMVAGAFTFQSPRMLHAIFFGS
jgi:uncharacterized membrane protein